MKACNAPVKSVLQQSVNDLNDLHTVRANRPDVPGWIQDDKWAPRALPPTWGAMMFEDTRCRVIQVRFQKWGRVFARCSSPKRVTVFRQFKLLERSLLIEAMLNRFDPRRSGGHGHTVAWAKRNVGMVQIDLGVVDLGRVKPTYCKQRDVERLHDQAILTVLERMDER